MARVDDEGLINSLEIRDTNAHKPSTDGDEVFWKDVHGWEAWLIHAENGMDQAVTITLYGNRDAASTAAGEDASEVYAFGLTVPARSGSTPGVANRLYSMDADGWTPWLWAQAQCSSIPTLGELNVWIMKVRSMRDAQT